MSSSLMDQKAALITSVLIGEARAVAGLGEMYCFTGQERSSPSREEEGGGGGGEEEEDSVDERVDVPACLQGRGGKQQKRAIVSVPVAVVVVASTATKKKKKKKDEIRPATTTTTKKREIEPENGAIASALRGIPLRRSDWKKKKQEGEEEEPVAKRAKVLPNQKFSCKQYTAEFVDWLDSVTALIDQQADHTVEFCISNEKVQSVRGPSRAKDEKEEWRANTKEAIGDEFLSVPEDGRCTGCRRCFKTKNHLRQKNLGFYKCACDRHRASHCLRCRVLQWALQIPVDSDGNVDATASIPCVGRGCQVEWNPCNLFVVSVVPQNVEIE